MPKTQKNHGMCKAKILGTGILDTKFFISDARRFGSQMIVIATQPVEPS